MTYLQFYIAAIVFFFVIERILPARKSQKLQRKNFWDDIIFLVFNGHYSGLIIYKFSEYLLYTLSLYTIFHFDLLDLDLISNKAIWLQVGVGLLVKDFFSWCVHNLLHRIPALWKFHKVHHSAKEMDFMVVMKFHWMEIIVYRTLLYIPLLLIGVTSEAFLYIIFIEVFWGFFNHSNFNIDIGPLKYIFNSPKMHIWHHENGDQMNLNFGITLSCWDWIFGTVHWPEGEPKSLGFPEIDSYPKHFMKQILYLGIKDQESNKPR